MTVKEMGLAVATRRAFLNVHLLRRNRVAVACWHQELVISRMIAKAHLRMMWLTEHILIADRYEIPHLKALIFDLCPYAGADRTLVISDVFPF